MIVVQLTGGLGNQMFQYALGCRLALLHDTDLKFDLSSYQNDNLRNFMLDCFNVRGEIASNREVDAYSKSSIYGLDNHFLNILVRWGLYEGPVTVSDEPPGRQALMVYNDQVLQAPRNTYVQGYWQSEKYFLPIRQTLLNDFTLRSEPDSANRVMLRKILSCTSVSLHIRRGDYVSNPMTNHSHGTCGLEYYENAVRYITDKVPSAHFFIFSDDMYWAQENLHTGNPTAFMNINDGMNSHLDMELMRHCKHHIIANSSFSWWGAWLNEDPKKIVIAPKKWFNNLDADTRDLIPGSWLRM